MNSSTDVRVPNADEIAYWDSEAGPRWAALQQQVDRVFAPLGAAGIAAAKLQRAEAVLDIGCGCGATLLELAAAVGAEGSVVGVDVSRSMLAVAQARALTQNLANVRCIVADASTYAFEPATFDLAFSRFGVMFFDQPVDALGNVRTSLRDRGRLVFVCWRELRANPWFYVPADAVRPHVPVQPSPEIDAPGPLAFADPHRVRRILERAGFTSVEFEKFDANVSLGTRTSALELLSQIGPTADLLAHANESARVNAIFALDNALGAHEIDGEVVLGAGVWIVSARASNRQ